MDHSSKVLQAAARDAAARARLLADALDAVADAADILSQVPQVPSAAVHIPAIVDTGQLWTVADVAKFVGASESWVRHAVGAGRLPCTRIGGLLRFQPDEIRAHTRSELPPDARVLPRTARRHPRE